MTACPVCSGATDVPDGRGGIMPCPECQNRTTTWYIYNPPWTNWDRLRAAPGTKPDAIRDNWMTY